jgi:hypothetical protein
MNKKIYWQRIIVYILTLTTLLALITRQNESPTPEFGPGVRVPIGTFGTGTTLPMVDSPYQSAEADTTGSDPEATQASGIPSVRKILEGMLSDCADAGLWITSRGDAVVLSCDVVHANKRAWIVDMKDGSMTQIAPEILGSAGKALKLMSGDEVSLAPDKNLFAYPAEFPGMKWWSTTMCTIDIPSGQQDCLPIPSYEIAYYEATLWENGVYFTDYTGDLIVIRYWDLKTDSYLAATPYIVDHWQPGVSENHHALVTLAGNDTPFRLTLYSLEEHTKIREIPQVQSYDMDASGEIYYLEEQNNATSGIWQVTAEGSELLVPFSEETWARWLATDPTGSHFAASITTEEFNKGFWLCDRSSCEVQMDGSFEGSPVGFVTLDGSLTLLLWDATTQKIILFDVP